MNTTKVPTTIEQRREVLASFHAQMAAVRSVYDVILRGGSRPRQSCPRVPRARFRGALSRALRATEEAMNKASAQMPAWLRTSRTARNPGLPRRLSSSACTFTTRVGSTRFFSTSVEEPTLGAQGSLLLARKKDPVDTHPAGLP